MKTYPRQELFEESIITLKDVFTWWDGDLTWKGNLYLDNTQITRLPDGLTVWGYLSMEDTPITKLPENLTINKTLYIRDTPIKRLPDSLSVGEVVIDRKLDYIPKHLKDKIIYSI